MKFIKIFIKKFWHYSSIYVITFSIIFLLFVVITYSQHIDVIDLDYDVEVSQDKYLNTKSHVSETITYDIKAFDFLKYKKINKKLSEITSQNTNSKITNIKLYSIENDEKIEIPQFDKQKPKSEYDNINYFDFKKDKLIIKIDPTKKDIKKYLLTYDIEDNINCYSDCQVYSLNIFKSLYFKGLKNLDISIKIPKDLMSNNYFSYLEGTNLGVIELDKDEDELNYILKKSLDKKMLKSDIFSGKLYFNLASNSTDLNLFNNNSFIKKSQSNYFDEFMNDYNGVINYRAKLKQAKLIIFISCIFLSSFVIIFAVLKIIIYSYRFKTYKPNLKEYSIKKNLDKQDIILCCELLSLKYPSGEFAKKKQEYAAILLRLINKRYITIKKKDKNRPWKSYNTILKLNLISNSKNDTKVPDSIIKIDEKVNLNSLTTSEYLYLNLLKRYSKDSNYEISMLDLKEKMFKDTKYLKIFVKTMESEAAKLYGLNNGYFQNKNYNKIQNKLLKSANRSLYLASLILIVVNILFGITPLGICNGAFILLSVAFIIKYFIYYINSSKFILLTQYGINEQEKWNKLYKTIKNKKLDNTKINNRQTFENYLIYSTAFGLLDEYISQMDSTLEKLDELNIKQVLDTLNNKAINELNKENENNKKKTKNTNKNINKNSKKKNNSKNIQKDIKDNPNIITKDNIKLDDIQKPVLQDIECVRSLTNIDMYFERKNKNQLDN